MFHQIFNIATTEKHTMIAHFTDGEFRVVNIKQLADEFHQFQTLIANQELFKKAQVDVGGYGIVWDDELDLSADYVYEHGAPIPPVLDMLTKEQFDAMMEESLNQVRNGETIPLDEAFASIRKKLN